MLLQYSPTNVVLLANSIGRLDVDYVCTIEISSSSRRDYYSRLHPQTLVQKKKEKSLIVSHMPIL